jgi:hypothetical protein
MISQVSLAHWRDHVPPCQPCVFRLQCLHCCLHCKYAVQLQTRADLGEYKQKELLHNKA